MTQKGQLRDLERALEENRETLLTSIASIRQESNILAVTRSTEFTKAAVEEVLRALRSVECDLDLLSSACKEFEMPIMSIQSDQSMLQTIINALESKVGSLEIEVGTRRNS